MKAISDFTQFVNRDGADPFYCRKQDRNCLLRILEVFHEGGMIDTRAVPMFAPNGPRMRPVHVANDCNPDDGCGWAGSVNPEPGAISKLGNPAAKLDSFCSIQDCIRVTGMN